MAVLRVTMLFFFIVIGVTADMMGAWGRLSVYVCDSLGSSERARSCSPGEEAAPRGFGSFGLARCVNIHFL